METKLTLHQLLNINRDSKLEKAAEVEQQIKIEVIKS